MPTEPKKVLCIHDLSGAGRCSLAVILPVLAVMGVQPVALPTMLLSTHTGGLGEPARQDCQAYGHAALTHYRELGLAFDCIYTGYLGSSALVDLAAEAFRLWPGAFKVADPVMADGGKPYSGFTPDVIEKVRSLCRAADLILPNLTEAKLLLGLDPALPSTISAISMVSSSVTRRPLMKWGSIPTLPTQRLISLPPPCTMMGLKPQSFRRVTSWITRSFKLSSTMALPPYFTTMIFRLNRWI